MRKIMLLAILSLLAVIPISHAHCPLCTAAVGAAAVSANYYGLDISIIGLLIGAFGVSTGLWVARMVKRQYIGYQTHLIVLLSFLLTVIPLMSINNESFYLPLLLFGEIGSAFNKVYFLNRLLIGSIFGGIISLGALWVHFKLKALKGKVLFPFQGIVITLLCLFLAGIGLYFI